MDNKNLIFILIILVIIFNCKVSCNRDVDNVNLDNANGLGTFFQRLIKKDNIKMIF